MDLAKKYDLKDYPCPAGGCLLTDSVFARKVKDLIDHDIRLELDEIKLLRFGRHFRLSPKCRLVVGRNETDWLIKARDFEGPISCLRGEITAQIKESAAKITGIYGQGRREPYLWVELVNSSSQEEIQVNTDLKPEDLVKYRIGTYSD